jgi:hypothetical protein
MLGKKIEDLAEFDISVDKFQKDKIPNLTFFQHRIELVKHD